MRPTEREDTAIPERDLKRRSYLGGKSLGELIGAEFQAARGLQDGDSE